MTIEQLSILLVGEEAAGIKILHALHKSVHRIIAVLASPEKKHIGSASLWDVANHLGYVTWPATLVRDCQLVDQLKGKGIDLLVNVHSLYRIGREILEIPRIGCFNLHPGLLPQYAGINVVNWAIYRDEKTYGVTIHRMTPDIDAGDIAYQTLFPIVDQDNGLSISRKCVDQGVKLMLQLIETAATDLNRIPAIPQDLSKREYYGNPIPNAGFIDWSDPARKIFNFVRACDYYPLASPWGLARGVIAGKEINLLKTNLTRASHTTVPGVIGPRTSEGIWVACSDEWLEVCKVVLDGKVVDACDVLSPGKQFEVNPLLNNSIRLRG